jgi:hypothetical protein
MSDFDLVEVTEREYSYARREVENKIGSETFTGLLNKYVFYFILLNVVVGFVVWAIMTILRHYGVI